MAALYGTAVATGSKKWGARAQLGAAEALAEGTSKGSMWVLKGMRGGRGVQPDGKRLASLVTTGHAYGTLRRHEIHATLSTQPRHFISDQSGKRCQSKQLIKTFKLDRLIRT
jgi:hypothetical protein